MHSFLRIGFVIMAAAAAQPMQCDPSQFGKPPRQKLQAVVSDAHVRGVNLTDAAHPAPHDQPIIIAAAKNEWASFAVQLTNVPKPTNGKTYTLRIAPPQ